MAQFISTDSDGDTTQHSDESMDVSYATNLLLYIGRRDYSLLNEIHEGKPGLNEQYEDDVKETTHWLNPEELLREVEKRLSEERPRLAISETLGVPSMLQHQWTTPVIPCVVGALKKPVPRPEKESDLHVINFLAPKGCKITSSYPIIDFYRMYSPKIYASSGKAMVIHSKMRSASSCRSRMALPLPCNTQHLLDDIIVDTTAVYRDIMKEMIEIWDYVEEFVDTGSFIYTTQVFVRGIYPRENHTLGTIEHEPITLVYPITVVPSNGVCMSTAMRNCFKLPTKGLIEITDFSLVISCHGPRPRKYYRYTLDSFSQRTRAICSCEESAPGDCSCAEHYMDTLLKLSDHTRPGPNHHPIAACNVAHNMKVAIAYNTFTLIDELMRNDSTRVKTDDTMRANNVLVEMDKYGQAPAAFLRHSIQLSSTYQPVQCTTICLNEEPLKTVRDVVNAVGQMCAAVLFTKMFGNPDRTTENDNRYNAIVEEILDMFPGMEIKKLPVFNVVKTSLHACDVCNKENYSFTKIGFKAMKVCNGCDSNMRKEKLPQVVSITR